MMVNFIRLLKQLEQVKQSIRKIKMGVLGEKVALLAVYLFTCVMVLVPSQVNAAADPLVGDWQAFDEKTGMKRSIVRITKDKKTGTFIGRVIKRFNIVGANNDKVCKNCPKPFTNKKVEGMTIIWNLKKNENNKSARYPYQGGYVIDPTNGKIYGMKVSVSRNGDMMKGLGYVIGMEAISRRQTWIRKK